MVDFKQMINKIRNIIKQGIFLNGNQTVDSTREFENWIHYSRIRNSQKLNHNTILEFIWTVFPIIILILIAIPSMKSLYYLENPINQESLSKLEYKIVVIGHQWYWTYNCDLIDYNSIKSNYILTENKRYLSSEFDSYMLSVEDTINISGARLLEVDNALILPYDSTLSFLITSSDVLHAWSIPSMGLKMDAVPGRLSMVTIIPIEEGIFYGQCSEICGIGHGFMPIKMILI